MISNAVFRAVYPRSTNTESQLHYIPLQNLTIAISLDCVSRKLSGIPFSIFFLSFGESTTRKRENRSLG